MFQLLVSAALKGTIVLLVAGAIATLLRRNSAAHRHLVWQLAVIAMLGLPIVTALSPLRVPVLPRLSSFVSAPPQVPAASATPVDRKVEHKASQQNTTTPVFTTSSTRVTRALPMILFWLGAAWLVVAALLLARLLFGFGLVRWFALRAYPLYEDGWSELNQELSSMIGLRSSVQLYASPHVATPMTWGFRHPVVMMPSMAEDWPEERRRVVLLHELAHIRRRDSLTHLFAQVTCSVYWFHPLVWKAAARMRAEAERACDDLVLGTGTKASVYANHLLDLIRTIGTMRTPALALPMAERSTFEGRLLAILEPHTNRAAPRPLSVLGMVVVVALIVLPLAGLSTATIARADAFPMNVSDGVSTKTETPAWWPKPPQQKKLNSKLQEALTTQTVQSMATSTAQTTVFATTSQQPQQSAATLTALQHALSDTDPDVRMAAVQSLGQIEDSTAVAALSNALRNDSDARVRKMAAWALGQIEDKAAVPALINALQNDKDVDVRRTAVWALGQIEDRSAVPALSAAIRDSDADVRKTAIWALGQIEDKSALPALEGALKSDDADIRDEAVWALGQIEAKESVPALAALRNDPVEEVRSKVAWALGQIEDQSSVPALSDMLRADKIANVRKQAAWALGQIEARPAPQALLDALKDSDREVRAMAAWALAQTEDPNSAAALRGAMKDTDPTMRREVLRALGAIGDDAAYAALSDMLKDPDPEVRRAAAQALGGHGGNPDPRPNPQPRPQPRPIN